MQTERIKDARICLASKSPRRLGVLKEMFPLGFEVFSPNVDETLIKDKPPEIQAVEFSLAKAKKAQEHFPHCIIISADTLVVSPNGVPFGKPEQIAQAREMLRALNGKEHKVVTAMSVCYNEKTISDIDTARVRFNMLSNSQIDAYIERFKPFDKAGAYGIQDDYPLIKEIIGDYGTVLGLSKKRLQGLLDKL